MAGFTWSSVSTMSPITTACAPARVKAAQAVSPSGGVIFAPAVVTDRSLRGTCTLKTPSFSDHCPFRPVICSMRAESTRLGAEAGAASSQIASVAFSMKLLSLQRWHMRGAALYRAGVSDVNRTSGS